MKEANLRLAAFPLSAKVSHCLVSLLLFSIINSLKRANINSDTGQNIPDPAGPYTVLR